MSLNRCIFTIGSVGDNPRSAGYLGSVFYPDRKVLIVDLAAEHSLDVLDDAQLHKIVILGHGSTSSFGGYDASEFVRLFKRQFRRKFSEADKSKIRDLYLIGCDVGLVSDEDGGSLAQEIATAMADAGFGNAVIHCVAKPENCKGDVLYVEVLSCSGAAGLHALTAALHEGGVPDLQTGYIKAYLLAKEDADRIAVLERDKSKHRAEIADIIRQKSFLLINHAHPEFELNKPHNVFYPRETSENRRLRIVRDTARLCSAEHTEANALLQHRRDQLAQKSMLKEEIMGKKLDFLIFQMKLVSDDHWPHLITEYTRYLQNHVLYGAFFHDDSTTVKLLEALSKKKMAKARKIVEESTTPAKPGLMRGLFQTRQQQVVAAKVIDVQPVLSDELRGRINAVTIDLQNELDRLRGSCFRFLLYVKIDEKRQKLAVLQNILRCHDLASAQLLARNALAEQVVTGGFFSTRTRDLLNAVAAEFPPRAIIPGKQTGVKR